MSVEINADVDPSNKISGNEVKKSLQIHTEKFDKNFPEITKSTARDHLTLNGTRFDENIDKWDDIYHSYKFYAPREIDYINKRYRNGILNPYQTVSTVREYLFFTKPDLNIFSQSATREVQNTTADGLFGTLQNLPFWRYIMCDKYRDVLGCLQQSANINGSKNNKFNHLLSNMVQSNLEVPGISANVIETPVNLYGVGYSYRSSSEASDDNPTFSLEFRDTKYLPVYHFFKAYEEYETLKHHGRIIPSMYYIQNKILHDQYSVYKFLVDEDQETLLYWGKYYGVMSKTVPRDVFGNTTFDNGLSYTVEFSAAFYEDMRPEIINEFNTLSYPYWSTLKYDIGPFNPRTGLADNRPVKSAIITKEKHSSEAGSMSIIPGAKDAKESSLNTNKDPLPIKVQNEFPTPHLKDPGNWVYKLKWRGDDAN